MKSDSMRNDIWKWLSLLIIAVFSIYVTFPVKEKLRFGLDLKGGTSFTMGVDKDKLRESIIAENPAITNEVGAVEIKSASVLITALLPVACCTSEFRIVEHCSKVRVLTLISLSSF